MLEFIEKKGTTLKIKNLIKNISEINEIIEKEEEENKKEKLEEIMKIEIKKLEEKKREIQEEFKEKIKEKEISENESDYEKLKLEKEMKKIYQVIIKEEVTEVYEYFQYITILIERTLRNIYISLEKKKKKELPIKITDILETKEVKEFLGKLKNKKKEKN
jgi:hypothetical protein